MAATLNEQQHPLWYKDRAIVSSLLNGEPTDYNLVELARLKIRYEGFPGARDIQEDLAKLLQKWTLSEAQLFERTRQIHSTGKVYRSQNSDQEDWS
ncbi:MAG: DUF3288 family protein [Prochlorotrichaceae cyanobacterium]|jgi:hypothetical protein